MKRIFFFWLVILSCCRESIQELYKSEYGSILVVKPSAKYEVKDGTLTQTSRFFSNCSDSVLPKYPWNGSAFLIGPLLSSHRGAYLMRLENNSNIWENRSIDIRVLHKPHVQSTKVIVDQGDTLSLTCTYQSNCNEIYAVWTKDKTNRLRFVKLKKLENNTKSLTYTLKKARKQNSKLPYYCLMEFGEFVTVHLDVKDPQAPDVQSTNGTKWLEENTDAKIHFSILGSPVPNLTCIHEKTKEEIISCSKTQMKNILYRAQNKPCKSQNGKYILSSRSSQTAKVQLLISKVKFETDNSTLFCRLTNSKGQQKDFRIRLFVNVKERTKKKSNNNNNNKNLFIAIGCGLLLLFVVVIATVLYIKERNRNNTYKRFFLANNHYTIDPLKTLNEQMHNLSYDEDWEFPYKYLEFKELIGCGAFGKVYKAKAYGIGLMNSRDKSTHAKKQRKQLNKTPNKTKLAHCEENESRIVAVKTTKDNPNFNDIRNLAGELKMIIHVGQHENIVNVLGACTKYPKLYMIIEYCSHGSLLEFLRKRRPIFQPTWLNEDFAATEKLTIANLVSTAIQVCNGMRFLASKKCIHRDLAARNVLVADNYVMKVADFGMAREVEGSDNYICRTQGYLPVKWMALESILEKVYTEESDVWSFGILLWEMFTLGQTPYPSIPVQHLVALLSDCGRMEKPDYCPAEIYLIMLECWNEIPKQRPSFEALYAKLQKLLQINVIEAEISDPSINMDSNYKEDVCTEPKNL